MYIVYTAQDMTSNITIRIDTDLKKEAEELFADLGMNLTTAINVFFRQSIRRQRLPFEVRRFNDETLAAIEEGRRIARDPNTPSYGTMEELKKALHE